MIWQNDKYMIKSLIIYKNMILSFMIYNSMILSFMIYYNMILSFMIYNGMILSFIIYNNMILSFMIYNNMILSLMIYNNMILACMIYNNMIVSLMTWYNVFQFPVDVYLKVKVVTETRIHLRNTGAGWTVTLHHQPLYRNNHLLLYTPDNPSTVVLIRESLVRWVPTLCLTTGLTSWRSLTSVVTQVAGRVVEVVVGTYRVAVWVPHLPPWVGRHVTHSNHSYSSSLVILWQTPRQYSPDWRSCSWPVSHYKYVQRTTVCTSLSWRRGDVVWTVLKKVEVGVWTAFSTYIYCVVTASSPQGPCYVTFIVWWRWTLSIRRAPWSVQVPSTSTGTSLLRWSWRQLRSCRFWCTAGTPTRGTGCASAAWSPYRRFSSTVTLRKWLWSWSQRVSSTWRWSIARRPLCWDARPPSEGVVCSAAPWTALWGGRNADDKCPS